VAFRFVYPVRIYHVIDGDSVRVWLDTGFYCRYETNARMWDIDAPEKKTKAGQLVSSVVENWLEARSDNLMFESVRPDKFAGRWGGYLYAFDSPKATLSTFLLNSGLAVYYDGGRRHDWSDDMLDTIESKCRELLR
jgi:endonuclease YncB( thermonuclease family)